MRASQLDTQEGPGGQGLGQDFLQAVKPDLLQSPKGPTLPSSPVLPYPIPGPSQEDGQTGVLAIGPELHLPLVFLPVIFSLLTFILSYSSTECTFPAGKVGTRVPTTSPSPLDSRDPLTG